MEQRTFKKMVRDGFIHALVGGAVGLCPATFFINKPEIVVIILSSAVFNSFIIGFLGITDLSSKVASIRRKQK